MSTYRAVLNWTSSDTPVSGMPCLVRLADRTLDGRLAGVDEWMRRPDGDPEARGRVAAVRVDLGGSMPDRVMQELALLDRSGQPFAAGITIGEGTPRRTAEPAGAIVWFTGLSGAGKSTLSEAVRQRLMGTAARVQSLDGDAVRANLNRDLGFGRGDREENMWRMAFVADLLARAGQIVLVSVISPYRSTRESIRRRCERFIEIYVNAPIEVCEERDVKGLYKRARSGQIPHFTGIGDPYEPPHAPEVECRTDRETLEESVTKVLAAIAIKWPESVESRTLRR